MEEENDDDDTNQRSTPDWTSSVMQPEEEEAIGNDPFNKANINVDEGNAAHPKQDAVDVAGNENVDVDPNVDADADADMNQSGNVATEADADVDTDMNESANVAMATDADADADVNADMNESVNVATDADADMNENVDVAMDVFADVDMNVGEVSEDKDPQDPLERLLKDVKGKVITTEEQSFIPPATNNVADGGGNIDVMQAFEMINRGLCQELSSTSDDALGALPTSVPSQGLDKPHAHNFSEGDDKDTTTSALNLSALDDQLVQKEQGKDELIHSQQQPGSTTPDWFVPAKSSFQNANWFMPASSSSQDADKLHVMNFMKNVDMSTMASTPNWTTTQELSDQEMQALIERLNCEKEEEEEQARRQYMPGTPNWFVPPTNSERDKNLHMKETLKWDSEMSRERETEYSTSWEQSQEETATDQAESDPTHPKMVQQGSQLFMYPLPDKDQLLRLPIYNTYHHHHIHELRKGNFDKSCPKSTNTDSSFHTHTSQHRPMKVEIRMFTFNYKSSVVAHFRNNNVRIRITSTQPATFTTLLLTHNWLQFVHHIVHRHDVHVVDASYPDHFNLTSVGSQTCTRTKTQCRLFGSVGDFFHAHFHEFIHTIFVSAPVQEDAMVYSKYLHLKTIRRPDRAKSDDAHHQEEAVAYDSKGKAKI